MKRLVVVALLLIACACNKPKPGPGATSTGPSAALELPPLIPASAILVVGFQAPEAWLTKMATAGGLSAAEAKQLHDDVALYFKKTTGLELAKVHRGTIFGTADDAGALIVRDVGGEWKAPLPEGEIAVARHADYLIIGARPAVDAALAVAGGKAPGLAKDAPLAALFAKESAGAAFAVAVDAAHLPIPDVQAAAAQFGITYGFAAMGGKRIHLVVNGDGKKLTELVKMAEAQLASTATMLEQQKGRVLDGASVEQGVDPEALGVVIGAHTVKSFAAKFHPKVDGDTLRYDLDFEAPDAMVVVAVVGGLAAVAIPAFMKYIRKSKTTEAVAGIKRIYDAVRTESLKTKKFRASIPMTPAAGACCEQPGDKCAPDPGMWKTWEELGFSMREPFSYSYELESDGTVFTARAVGDLDCDGVFSTFEMAGRIEPDGSFKGSEGIYKDRELE